MKRKQYTITDISNMMQISRASVSRALSGAPGVGDELREKIIQFANEINYQPKSTSQTVLSKNSKIVGLILGDIRNPFYSNLVLSIQQVLSKHDYVLSIFNSEYDVMQELKFIEIAENLHFAGLLLITAQSTIIGPKLSEISIPKVLVNRIVPTYVGDSVLTDNFQAGYEAALHLINLGHREIGFIRGHDTSSAATQRYNGYLQALKNYSLPFQEDFIWQSDLRMETGRNIGAQFLELQHKPTALICINDMTSLGFLDTCRRNHFRIPEDLSLISFDDIPMSGLYGIELTTVSQHADIMGQEAARLLLKQFHSPGAQPERIILAPTVMIRNSTQAFTLPMK